MILVVCAVFDRALGAFGKPMVVPARGVAVRAFGDEVNRQGSEFNMHPADYELWQLGSFDDASGEFSGTKAKERIMLGSDAVKVSS